jgi:hypothetical protein
MDTLYRLRWNILTAVDDIKVAVGTNSQETVPFLDHVSAHELLADPPLSRLEVCIDAREKKHGYDYNEEQYRYQPPAPLTIDNERGIPITIRQFVISVHAYLNRNKEEIKAVKGELYGRPHFSADGTEVGRETVYGQNFMPSNTDIFFYGIMSNDRDPPILSVKLWADGERSKPLTDFWAMQLRRADMYEQCRLGADLSSVYTTSPGVPIHMVNSIPSIPQWYPNPLEVGRIDYPLRTAIFGTHF